MDRSLRPLNALANFEPSHFDFRPEKYGATMARAHHPPSPASLSTCNQRTALHHTPMLLLRRRYVTQWDFGHAHHCATPHGAPYPDRNDTSGTHIRSWLICKGLVALPKHGGTTNYYSQTVKVLSCTWMSSWAMYCLDHLPAPREGSERSVPKEAQSESLQRGYYC
ncbi:hypothetical protein BCR37DRAFT_91348 [Protomyces lactucae-debilis]|uniref:Uncharacterized protein n=1 Tax=Protomyces lactucae-debilis TaxID=2754530 RepID=A0A1Y2F7U0_PROLT|nr:uncharacterized protein BCR37DRAFT_91348 [Protomyces lactucae-debilis]ORY79436.1 hypothetical protein BCR37DRAFT_91348 [Protomyces lactucae-debilis]